MAKYITVFLALGLILSGCSYFKSDEDRMMDGDASARIDLSRTDGTGVPYPGQVQPSRYQNLPPYSPAPGVQIFPLDEDMQRTMVIYKK